MSTQRIENSTKKKQENNRIKTKQEINGIKSEFPKLFDIKFNNRFEVLNTMTDFEESGDDESHSIGVPVKTIRRNRDYRTKNIVQRKYKERIYYNKNYKTFENKSVDKTKKLEETIGIEKWIFTESGFKKQINMNWINFKNRAIINNNIAG